MRLEKSGRNELFEWDAIVFRRGDELSLETSEEKFILIAKKKKRKNSSTIKTSLDPRSIQESRKCKRTNKEKEEKESNHLFIFSQLPFKPF